MQCSLAHPLAWCDRRGDEGRLAARDTHEGGPAASAAPKPSTPACRRKCSRQPVPAAPPARPGARLGSLCQRRTPAQSEQAQQAAYLPICPVLRGDGGTRDGSAFGSVASRCGLCHRRLAELCPVGAHVLPVGRMGSRRFRAAHMQLCVLPRTHALPRKVRCVTSPPPPPPHTPHTRHTCTCMCAPVQGGTCLAVCRLGRCGLVDGHAVKEAGHDEERAYGGVLVRGEALPDEAAAGRQAAQGGHHLRQAGRQAGARQAGSVGRGFTSYNAQGGPRLARLSIKGGERAGNGQWRMHSRCSTGAGRRRHVFVKKHSHMSNT